MRKELQNQLPMKTGVCDASLHVTANMGQISFIVLALANKQIKWFESQSFEQSKKMNPNICPLLS